MKIQWLPEGTRLRPLRDQIVVKALEWRPSSVIEIAGNQRRPMRGEVVAVGPARRVKTYGRDSKGQRCKVYDYGQTIPTELRPGDIVELGGLELDGYHFQQVTIGSEVYVICQEMDVVFYRRPTLTEKLGEQWCRQNLAEPAEFIGKISMDEPTSRFWNPSEAGNGEQERQAT